MMKKYILEIISPRKILEFELTLQIIKVSGNKAKITGRKKLIIQEFHISIRKFAEKEK